MDLIIILGCVIIFFIVRYILLSVKQQRREKYQELVKYLNEVIHQVQVEHHYGIEYWFDQDDNRFLGQGSSIDEIIDVLKSRFPDHVFLLENQGGISAKTNWQIVPFDNFKNLNFISEERRI
jgi:hypothetical protein